MDNAADARGRHHHRVSATPFHRPGTFALARDMERSAPAALIAAAIFTCSSAMVFWVGWPLGRAWATLPFLFLAVRRVVHRRDARAFVLLITSLVLLILCGHPETVLHVTTIGGIWGLFELYRFRDQAWRAVAILLTAFFLLPFVALVQHSAEYRLRQDFAPAPWPSIVRSMEATFLPSEWDFGIARVGSGHWRLPPWPSSISGDSRTFAFWGSSARSHFWLPGESRWSWGRSTSCRCSTSA
jgi:hypothetical protein